MPPRKRRRSVAFAPGDDDDDDSITREVDGPSDDPLPAEGMANSEVWDAFREEYHEVLEQLPLTLQRAFILIRELDDQAQSNNTALVEYLRQYLQARTDHSRNGRGSASTDSLSSSKGLISRVAAITEENSRAAQERVNIAQSAYDSVDRQIRLLDQSIEEVEAMIALASHPDSQPRRILSYTVTGRWLRPRIEPLPQSSDHLPGSHESPTIGFSALDRSRGKTNTTSVQRTKKGKRRKNGQGVPPSPRISTVTGALVHPPEPGEPRYCYCKNVSYGDMVQCENGALCPYDWFHYDCLGLKKAPKGKWFCPECKPGRKGVRRKTRT